MNESVVLTRLLTRKDELNHTRVNTGAKVLPAGPGEAVLRLRRIALTTNNITYAAFGEAMQYWDFFPTGQAGWGHMPAWGFADVLSSTVDGLAEGERFYGYLPIASHLRVQAERVTERGFYDAAPHRLTLTSAYNQYMRCSADLAYSPAHENWQMLVRPLFITSFMLADFLQDNAFFGAEQVVFSSASSKTAYGTAFCLEGESVPALLALTSPRNLGFVRGLGCYGAVAVYDALSSFDKTKRTVYVDFSGDEALRLAVHRHFDEALVHDCYAGSAQNTHFLREQALPGPPPTLYFAPVQIRKRNADWGPAVVNQRFNEAQLAFIRRISEGPAPWMKIREHHGFAAAQALVADLHAGRMDPQQGHVVVLD